MTEVSVKLNLMQPQREALETALKGTKLNPFDKNGNAMVTKSNIFDIREAVYKSYLKAYKRKNKEAHHMAFCYSCERIINKIDDRLEEFGYDIPEVEDDGSQSIVSISKPSLNSALQEAELNKAREEIVNSIETKAEEPEESEDND